MVNRGQCTFTTKANVAEAAGASAVLIINDENGNILITSIFSFLHFIISCVLVWNLNIQQLQACKS